jgi:hypothetical protein
MLVRMQSTIAMCPLRPAKSKNLKEKRRWGKSAISLLSHAMLSDDRMIELCHTFTARSSIEGDRCFFIVSDIRRTKFNTIILSFD